MVKASCTMSAITYELYTTHCAFHHCTMRTLESRNSSGLIAPGHISKNHQRYSKERHFFFKLSTRRKIEKIQFPWVSYSKFSILAKYASVSYTQICIWYRAILLEDASDASVPLYKYGSILHTVPPYFPMYALCSVSMVSVSIPRWADHYMSHPWANTVCNKIIQFVQTEIPNKGSG